jgi:hypothetical protein
MATFPNSVSEARQLLSACGWCVDPQIYPTKTVYVVRDNVGTPRRSFVPPQRLLDYARGVFDAQEF